MSLLIVDICQCYVKTTNMQRDSPGEIIMIMFVEILNTVCKFVPPRF